MSATQPSRREALATVGWCWLATIAALLVLGRPYYHDASAWSLALAAVAGFASIACLPLALSAGLVAALPRRWCVRWLAPLPFLAVLVWIYADGVVYRLYNGLHLEMVLELLRPEGRDSFALGAGTLISGAGVVAVLAAVVLVAAGAAERLIARGRLPRGRRWWWSVAAALIAIGLADKLAYMASDARDDSAYTPVAQRLPLYARVTARSAMERLGLRSVRERSGAGGRSSLAWPKAPLVYAPDAPRPNILLVAIEGCRFDMLDPAVMPRLSAYAGRAIVGGNHWSGGNATRCGLFSLLYGLWGTSFQRVLAERRPALLIDEAVRLGYAPRILSCTDLKYPEFRQTAFIDVPDAITDAWEGPRVDRDRKMTDAFLAFLEQRRRPFIGFLFYDASHQPYSYPPEYERFTPVSDIDRLNYIKIAEDPRPYADPLRNRYKNALGYVDAQLGRLFDALTAAGLDDDTVVVVCGDHGEEFAEGGPRIGHNNAYSKWQVQTTFVLRIPGEAPRRIAGLTSHVDVVPTILARLGVTNPASDYSHGRDLTRGTSDYAVVAAWRDAAVVDAQGVSVFGTDVTNLGVERYDLDFRRSDAPPDRQRLLEVLKRMGEFQK